MDARIDELLTRTILGTATSEEERELRLWMEAHPGEAREARTVLEAARHEPAGEDAGAVDAAWARVRSRIEVDDVPSIPERLRRLRPALVRIAAVLVVGVGATVAVDAYLASGVVEVAPTVQREVATDRGERRPVVLPDGSRVTLAPASRLRYPDAFSGDRRAVQVDGRAFFDVTPDPARPFTVQAAQARVRVLGTRFDLRAYPEEEGARVAVEEGSVSLAPEAPDGEATGVVLEAGDLGRLVPGSPDPVRIRGGADERHFGWLQGRLVFRDAPLSDVLAELSRFYDIEFQAPDDLLVRRVSFTIDDQARSDVLELLALLLDLRVLTSGEVVRLEDRAGAP